MNTDARPGLDQQSTVRTTARVLAVVLLLVGVYLLFRGITGFVDQAQSMEVDADFGPILTIGAGGFCVVVGLAAANVGWLRAQASYVAGETVPVVKESIDHLTAGPYCRQCGTRNDTTARFCDSCGQSLA
jgi:hypothetical protein